MKLKTLFGSWSKLLLIFTGIVLSITINVVANEGVNPFNPIDSYVASGPTHPGGVEGAHPLQQNLVNEYILMGVIVSSKGKIGLIRAKNGGEYFVKIDDLLGNADGKITQINKSGIEVSEKDKVVSLLVRNRSVGNEKNK